MAAYHFARNGDGSVGDLEIGFFTREYGATCWEVWRRDVPSVPVQQAMNARCPGVPHEASFHGAACYMHDCRNWTTIIAPLDGTPWDPDGKSALSPGVRRWGLDPLYIGGNRLKGLGASAVDTGLPCT